MHVFVYSDESGVFDKAHNDFYVYGGLIFFGKEDKDNNLRKYLNAEKTIRNASGRYSRSEELKATTISNKEKSKLYRSLNACVKFGVIVDQKRVLNEIFLDKKSKQRFLDYAYKRVLKQAFVKLSEKGQLNLSGVMDISIFVDEHTTATNGKYELREGLEEEFKRGTYNYNYGKFYPPICQNLRHLTVKFCNSSTNPLIRAADITANRLYSSAVSKRAISPKDNLHMIYLP